MTTMVILVTFLLTLYQVYKYITKLMNTKVDYEGFSNPNSFIDRSPLVGSNSQNQAGRRQGDDGFQQSNL